MGIYVSTFFVTFLSGFLPFVNAEAYLVSVSALAPGATLAAVVAAATLGQMTAKGLLYLTGRGLLRLPLRRHEARTGRVRAFLAGGGARAAGTLGRLLRFAAVFLLPRLF